MSALRDLRDTLAADLAALGVPVHTNVAIRLDPPCVLLTAPIGGPYVNGGRELGSYVVSLDAVVLVEHRPPDEGREDLETLIEGLLRNSMDWALTGVDPPSVVTVADNASEYLGTVVHLSKAFYL